jgi:hypothetical protein
MANRDRVTPGQELSRLISGLGRSDRLCGSRELVVGDTLLLGNILFREIAEVSPDQRGTHNPYLNFL